MALHTWLGFVIASWLIGLSPGAGAVASISCGMNHGFRRALWNVAGLQAGIVVLMIAAGLGVSAFVAASPMLFDAIRWTGVIYLAWLGLQQLLARPQALQLQVDTGADAQTLFVRALLINISNPKGYVFMLAVLPSFVDAAAPLLPQYLLMTLTLMFTDLVVMCAYTGLGRGLASWLQRPERLVWVWRVFGILFLAAAAALAGFGRV